MTQDEKYNKFIKYIGYTSLEDSANFFKTSISSIKRYKSGDTPVPDSVLFIIDLYEETKEKQKTIDALQFEIKGIHQRIYDLKHSRERVFEIVD